MSTIFFLLHPIELALNIFGEIFALQLFGDGDDVKFGVFLFELEEFLSALFGGFLVGDEFEESGGVPLQGGRLHVFLPVPLSLHRLITHQLV